IRVGRQELNYGDGSLLAIRELNVRREFDGIKLLFRPEGWSVDAFAMRPVSIKPGFFDDPPDHEQTLWGVWANTTKNLPKLVTQLDVYYLGLDRKKATFNQGTAREQRHTLGINLRGGKNDLSFFGEGDVQFGKVGSGQLRAGRSLQSSVMPSRRYGFIQRLACKVPFRAETKTLPTPTWRLSIPCFQTDSITDTWTL
ncbi:MAG TPA: alginate export family protein, partial [Blastocatellia bacterium]|nr:alginate export family protein [Blastocatellia bacterium]